MAHEAPTVFIVDDDVGVLKALTRLARAAGYVAQPYASVEGFLRALRPETPGCIVLDLSMPELTGLELQDWLAGQGFTQPIVFLTGHGNIPASVRAMKAGAVDFLTKPVSDAVLFAAIDAAIERNRLARMGRAELDSIQERLGSLTPRERQVLAHVVAGRLNKQIAATLGTAEKTIKVHRRRVMDKMQVRTLADLVRVASRAGIGPPDGHP